MNKLQEYQKKHIQTMKNILQQLPPNFVLKGGTALLFGYHLDRYSEDIDLDIINVKTKDSSLNQLMDVVKNVCQISDENINIKKDGRGQKATTHRFMVDYGNKKDGDTYKLKIEVSLRNKEISKNDWSMIHGIPIYNIEELIGQKIRAYCSREKERDIYDVTFLTQHYSENIDYRNYLQLQESLEYKDVDFIESRLRLGKQDGLLSGVKDFDAADIALKFEENVNKGINRAKKLEEKKLKLSTLINAGRSR